MVGLFIVGGAYRRAAAAAGGSVAVIPTRALGRLVGKVRTQTGGNLERRSPAPEAGR